MIDQKQLEDALNKIFDNRRSIDEKTHAKHHAFIDEFLDERAAKKARAERIKAQVTAWGLITLLSGIGYMLYDWIRHVLHFK